MNYMNYLLKCLEEVMAATDFKVHHKNKIKGWIERLDR